MADVPEHDQRLTLHILAHVPEHEPREDDPHYHLFEQAKARLKRQGLWKCVIGDAMCSGPTELHHSHIEFSQINSVDPDKVAKAFGLHFANDEDFQAWIEGPGNLEPLCLQGDQPVLMHDGSTCPIAKVRVGDQVIGHDMREHHVTATMRSEFVGEVVSIDGHRMTGNHPVLTARGWIPAISVQLGDLVCRPSGPSGAEGSGRKFGMLDADVLSLSGVQPEVFGAIVAGDAVDVVDPFGSRQRPSDELLHDEPVLHDEPLPAGRPVDDPHVLRGADIALLAAPLPVGALQSGHPALVGAVAAQASGHFERLDDRGHATLGAGSLDVAQAPIPAAFEVAFPAARRVPLGHFRGSTVVVAARHADLNDRGVVTAFERRWSPVLHVERIPFTGQVYDIEVSGSRSFVTGDMVVHNCATHHRTHLGVHSLPGPFWEPLRYLKAGAKPPAEFVPAKEWNAKGT